MDHSTQHTDTRYNRALNDAVTTTIRECIRHGDTDLAATFTSWRISPGFYSEISNVRLHELAKDLPETRKPAFIKAATDALIAANSAIQPAKGHAH